MENIEKGILISGVGVASLIILACLESRLTGITISGVTELQLLGTAAVILITYGFVLIFGTCHCQGYATGR